MTLRFTRRLSIVPGLRVNLSKRGAPACPWATHRTTLGTLYPEGVQLDLSAFAPDRSNMLDCGASRSGSLQNIERDGCPAHEIAV
jgi:hypothetical protein